MPFDDLLYLREGAVDGDLLGLKLSAANLSTDLIKISETPVAGLGINVVVPEVVDKTIDHLRIDIYESDASTWTTAAKFIHRFASFPTVLVAGSYWDRIYTDKDYVGCLISIVSVATASVACDFGAVDIRLTDRFAKYTGQ